MVSKKRKSKVNGGKRAAVNNNRLKKIISLVVIITIILIITVLSDFFENKDIHQNFQEEKTNTIGVTNSFQNLVEEEQNISTSNDIILDLKPIEIDILSSNLSKK